MAPSKQTMVQALETVLQAAGVELTRLDERGQPKRRFGGHCLRVSGAQFLASAGTPTPLIQLLGRWSSMAVERYIQMAPLSIIPEMPAQVLSNFDNMAPDPSRLAWQATHGRPADTLGSDHALNKNEGSLARPADLPGMLKLCTESRHWKRQCGPFNLQWCHLNVRLWSEPDHGRCTWHKLKKCRIHRRLGEPSAVGPMAMLTSTECFSHPLNIAGVANAFPMITTWMRRMMILHLIAVVHPHLMILRLRNLAD